MYMNFNFRKPQNIKFHPIIVLLTSLVISLSLVFFSNAQAYTAPINSTPELSETIKSLEEQIKLLNQQILDLQSRVEKTEQEVEVVKAELKFTRSLQKGVSGDEVKQLQEFLKQFPDIYPEGIVTGFFGSLTETAVKRFQEKHGIESVGIVGPRTIQKLNEFSVSASPAVPATPVIPAIPAIPASPSQPLVSPTIIPKPASGSFTPTLTPVTQSATPAIPAQPATPAQPAGSTSIPTPTPTPSPVATSMPTPTPTPAVVQPTAPAGLVIDKGTTLHLNPPAVNYSARFNYTLASDTKSFRVYLKRPDSANFIPYTYDAQLPLSQGNESTASPFLRRTDPSSWYWWPADEFLPNADLSRFGEYKIYVIAINTAGVESVPSETKTIRIYAPPVISSPAEGSTVSTKPTITFTAGDSNVGSQNYAVYIYKANGTVVWSNGLAATNFTYSGTDLNPNDNPHRLVVHSYAAAPNFPYWYSPFSQTTFSVSVSAQTSVKTTSFFGSILEGFSKIFRR